MKNLIIVRHAKSSWDYDISDYDRPLLPRGIDRAQSHAALLKGKLNETPTFWASSYATRALHTAVIFSKEFHQLERLNIKQDLYTFFYLDLKKAIAEFPNEMDSAIIFGHNDACIDLIGFLTGESLFEFKTASVASISFKQDNWHDIADGKLNFLISKGKIQ